MAKCFSSAKPFLQIVIDKRKNIRATDINYHDGIRESVYFCIQTTVAQPYHQINSINRWGKTALQNLQKHFKSLECYKCKLYGNSFLSLTLYFKTLALRVASTIFFTIPQREPPHHLLLGGLTL